MPPRSYEEMLKRADLRARQDVLAAWDKLKAEMDAGEAQGIVYPHRAELEKAVKAFLAHLLLE